MRWKIVWSTQKKQAWLLCVALIKQSTSLNQRGFFLVFFFKAKKWNLLQRPSRSPDRNPADSGLAEQQQPTVMSCHAQSCVTVHVLAPGFTPAWKSGDGSTHPQAAITEDWISHPGLKIQVALLWRCASLSKQKKILASRRMRLLARGSKAKVSPISTMSRTDISIRIQTEKILLLMFFSFALSAFTTNSLQRTRICTEVRTWRSKTCD